jgi:hypothetical protein
MANESAKFSLRTNEEEHDVPLQKHARQIVDYLVFISHGLDGMWRYEYLVIQQ